MSFGAKKNLKRSLTRIMSLCHASGQFNVNMFPRKGFSLPLPSRKTEHPETVELNQDGFEESAGA